MKLQTALLTLALTIPSFAHAKNSVKVCAFGETTADLADLLDQNGGKKIWYRGEQLSVHSEQRLQGLTAVEKDMIILAQASTASASDSDAEKLKNFANAEGYITYFQHGSNGREFVMAGSYPGDNEFGVILEIQPLKGRGDYKILSTAAVIADGDHGRGRIAAEIVA